MRLGAGLYTGSVQTMATTPASPEGLPRWRLLLFWTILVILLLGTGEVAANLYLRLASGYDGQHLYQYVFDPYKNILPTPDYVDTRGVRHNSVGFRRSSEVSVAKPPNTLRIFLMGGSTAYGLGGLWKHIEDRYPVLKNSETIDAYLERFLRDTLQGVNVEVINAAITSTWTHHELIYLNQSILRYEPDIVLFLDGFNDSFHTDPNHDQFASYSYNMPSRIIMGEPTMYSLAYANGWWIFRKSALAHVTGRGLRVIKPLITRKPQRQPLDVQRSLEGLRADFPSNALKMHRRIGLILKDEAVHPVFMLQPLLVLQRDRPSMVGVERQLFDFNVASYRPNYEDFIRSAVDYVRMEEAGMAAEIGGSFIDLTTVFDTISGQVFTDYAHLTPLGNEIVARRIIDQIISLICRWSPTDPAHPDLDLTRLRALALTGCSHPSTTTATQ